MGLTTGLLDADSLADTLEYVLVEGKPPLVMQAWADARREVFTSIVDPVSSANRLRCHDTDRDNPTSDPFFRMLLAEDNDAEREAVASSLAAMATDMSRLVGSDTRH